MTIEKEIEALARQIWEDFFRKDWSSDHPDKYKTYDEIGEDDREHLRRLARWILQRDMEQCDLEPLFWASYFYESFQKIKGRKKNWSG